MINVTIRAVKMLSIIFQFGSLKKEIDLKSIKTLRVKYFENI